MENQQPENKHEWSDDLRETLGVDPDELLATIDSYMKLYRKHVLLQFPLKDALMQSLKELFEHQYPGIKPYHHGWHINWVFEAMETCGNTMSIELVEFFEKVENGNDYKVGFKDYEQTVQLFTKPYEAKRFSFDYSNVNFTAEQIERLEKEYEKEYQEDITGFAELNRLRTEFEEVVRHVVDDFFAEQLETLSPDEMIHYRVIVGMGYEDYFEYSKELRDYLIVEKMQDYPGLGFHEFVLKEFERLKDVCQV